VIAPWFTRCPTLLPFSGGCEREPKRRPTATDSRNAVARAASARVSLLLDLLFASASEPIIELGRDPKRLGALCGVTGVVHTWGRNLSFHPHLHCAVTGGGLSPDGTWVDSAEKYRLPVKVPASMFRGTFLAGLARLFTEGKLAPGPRATGLAVTLAQPAAFAHLKDALYKKNWNVFAKAPFENPGALFRYLLAAGNVNTKLTPCRGELPSLSNPRPGSTRRLVRPLVPQRDLRRPTAAAGSNTFWLARALLSSGNRSGCSIESTARSMSNAGQYKWPVLGRSTAVISRIVAS
jgi:Putative transposase